jgi:hypothetical protein
MISDYYVSEQNALCVAICWFTVILVLQSFFSHVDSNNHFCTPLRRVIFSFFSHLLFYVPVIFTVKLEVLY